jgi:hypothetical protein
MMQRATVKQYGVSLTSWFSEAVSFPASQLEITARQLLIRFAGYGLRPVELVQRQGDKLFDYDLTFSLFSRNGSFRLSSEGAYVTLQNARDEKDAGIIIDCLLGFMECLSGRAIREHRLEVSAHAAVSSVMERDQFLAGLGSGEHKLPVGGCIFYVPAESPFGEARVYVDRSLLLPHGVFLGWSTQFGAAFDQELLKKAAMTFKSLTENLGLQMTPAQL